MSKDKTVSGNRNDCLTVFNVCLSGLSDITLMTLIIFVKNK